MAGRKTRVAKALLVLAIIGVVPAIVGGAGGNGSVNLTFTVQQTGGGYFQAAYYYNVNSSDASWWSTHPPMKMFIQGSWQPDASNHTFNWYVRQGSPQIKQLYYFDVYWDWLYSSTISTNPTGWNTKLLSICNESCFLHTSYPLTASNRMTYGGKTSTLLYNPNSTILRQFLVQQLGNIVTTGKQLWPGCFDSLCYNDAQTPQDGVMLDDAGATWDNAGASAEYSLSSNWTANEATWDQAKFGLYQNLANYFHPIGKLIIINLGGWLAYGQSQIAAAMAGADGWIDEWQGGIAGANSPSWVFGFRMSLIQIPAMQRKSFYLADLLPLTSWGSSSGVDTNRRHRIVLAEEWMLQTPGVNINVNELDASYGNHPVTGGTPFGPLYQSYYDAQLGNPLAPPTRRDFSYGSLWTRSYSGGFVALTLPSSGTASLTNTYNVTVPQNKTLIDVQTCKQASGTITLQNGDSAILVASGTKCGYVIPQSLSVFPAAILLGILSTAIVVAKYLRPDSRRSAL